MIEIVMDSEYTEQQKYDIFHLMSTYGGSFAKALSYAWFTADPDNRAKIEEAFAELIRNYANR